MNLQGTPRQVGDITIVDLSGRITLGDGSVVLREILTELTQGGHLKIILNLEDVDYIDSSGIGELVSAYTTSQSGNGELKLLNLTRRVHDLLQITKLYTVFDIYSDERSALAGFR